jgi:hypothetical protein
MRTLQPVPLSHTLGSPVHLQPNIHGQQGRRAKQRFTLALPLTYRVVKGKGGAGSGTTLNISSTGLRFTTEVALTPGLRVQLALTWPALLNGTVPVKLMIDGTVIRASATDAAAKIRSYEFHTSARGPAQPRQMAR